MRARGAVVVGSLAVALAACQANETRPLHESDYAPAGAALAASLAAAEVRAGATVKVVGASDDPLVDVGERRALESGKFVEAIHDRERRPDYALVPEREAEGVSWELIEVPTKRRVFKTYWAAPKR